MNHTNQHYHLETSMNDMAVSCMDENANRHARRWLSKNGGQHFRNPEHFVALVIEELGEYVRAYYDGDDLPALELLQAGGLIINALRQFYSDAEILQASEEEQRRHPSLEEK